MKSNVFVGVKGYGAIHSEKYQEKFDYMLVPITNSRYREVVKQQYTKYKNGVVSDLKISPPQLQDLGAPIHKEKENSVEYVGLFASWLELENSDEDIGEVSFQVLRYEFEYARCFGIKKIILAPPRNLNNLSVYAGKIVRLLAYMDSSYNKYVLPLFSISLPMFEESDPLSTWELWHTVSKLCKNHPSLTITLAIPRHRTPSYVLHRWLAEPVSCLLLSTSIFATNQHNYPVLNRFNQDLIRQFQNINGSAESISGDLTIILHGMEKHVEKVKGGETIYLDYINYLLKKGDEEIAVGSSVGNLPQIMPPLQPNAVDLTNSIYHTFEKDRAKYDMYGLAIQQALKTILTETQKSWRDTNINILVAGAGRGCLVDRTLKCLKKLHITNFKIIAIEKNPQALLYLQKKNYENWERLVEVVPVDMRDWYSSIKIDLCISELLGSFGCNELSPECLEPLEKRNCSEKTIFIPKSYTSYVALVSSPLAYQKLKKLNTTALESPWILHNVPYCILSSKINELWKFKHPDCINTKFKSVATTMNVKHKCEVHGFMGYFTANLYGNIELSILPDDSTVKLLDKCNEGEEKMDTGPYKRFSHTKNIISWSPMFFPLKSPLYITDNTEVKLNVSRNSDGEKVWYEWSLNCFIYIVVNDDTKYDSTRSQHRSYNQRLDSRASTVSQKFKHSDAIQDGFSVIKPSPNLHNAYDYIDSTVSLDSLEETTESGIFKKSYTMDHEKKISEVNGWNSIRDVYNSENGLESFFVQKGNDFEDRDDREASTYEEYHVRVKTDVTELHNIGGIAHSIKLLPKTDL